MYLRDEFDDTHLQTTGERRLAEVVGPRVWQLRANLTAYDA